MEFKRFAWHSESQFDVSCSHFFFTASSCNFSIDFVGHYLLIENGDIYLPGRYLVHICQSIRHLAQLCGIPNITYAHFALHERGVSWDHFCYRPNSTQCGCETRISISKPFHSIILLDKCHCVCIHVKLRAPKCP